MCDLCHYTPCIKSCPNYDKDKEGFIVCHNCKEHLYQGDTYYPDLDVCEFCIDEYLETVEIISKEEYMADQGWEKIKERRLGEFN